MSSATFDADRFVDDLDRVVERHVAGLELPARFVAADAALTEVGLIASKVRAMRGRYALELRADPHAMTWGAIGDLLDVTPQRAEQYAQQADDDKDPND